MFGKESHAPGGIDETNGIVEKGTVDGIQNGKFSQSLHGEKKKQSHERVADYLHLELADGVEGAFEGILPHWLAHRY